MAKLPISPSHPRLARLRIVLVSPRIAVNVGAVARTAMGLSAELHLVGPLGFQLDKSRIKRGSVGFWEALDPKIYKDSKDFWERFEWDEKTEFSFATKHGKDHYFDRQYGEDVVLIFGNEEEGVDESFWDFKGLPLIHSCRIPMNAIRCLNLSVSVGVIGFEVCRQWIERGWFPLSQEDGLLRGQRQTGERA